MKFIQNIPPTASTLIITNASGTGHLQATSQVERELTKQCPKGKFITKEVMTTLHGKLLGGYINKRFNAHLRKENISAINATVRFHWLDRWIITPFTTLRFISLLCKHRITHVVDTQPVSLKALLLAARIVNLVRRLFRSPLSPIKVSLVLTEMPTKECKDFFPQIKFLNRHDRKIFTLISTKPLLENQTEEQFWRKNCGLYFNKGQVVYDAFPLRPAFEKLKNNREPIRELKVKVASPAEVQAIQATTGLTLKQEQEKLLLPLKPQDQVTFLMLGGQACVEATKKYVQKMIEIAKKSASTDDHYLFVFCGKNDSENSLFNQVLQLVKKAQGAGYPTHLKVVPLTFQSDSEIAPILARSTTSITKSGGLTSMEVHTLAQGKIFIHSSYPGDSSKATEKELLFKGMSIWEAGNARYLQNYKGAKTVTPEIL